MPWNFALAATSCLWVEAHSSLLSLRVVPDAARSAFNACFPEGGPTYHHCCWCSAEQVPEDAGRHDFCWQGGRLSFEACCVFPWGSSAIDSRIPLHNANCRVNGESDFGLARLNLGAFQPVLDQRALVEGPGQEALPLSPSGFLLAQLLVAGWLPEHRPGRDGGTSPRRTVLEVCAKEGTPSMAAALLGHSAAAATGKQEIWEALQRNALDHGFEASMMDLANAPELPDPPDIVLMAGCDVLGDAEVQGLQRLCGFGTRVLAVLRLQSSESQMLRRSLDVIELAEPEWVEEGLWLPSGYKFSALEMRRRL